MRIQRKPKQKQIKGRRKCLENRSPGKLNVLCITHFIFFFFLLHRGIVFLKNICNLQN